VRVVLRFAPAFLVTTALALTASAARASGPLLFQHGGRATAQVGAFVGRATDAGGLDYNPAIIARLQGSHYQLGFDYTAPVDDYKSSTGNFRQKHLVTESPSIYASWHLPKDYYPLAFGIGLDRFLNRLQRLELWSVHPVVAYQLGERWSVGAGMRYYTGNMEEGRNQVVSVDLNQPPNATFRFPIEFERTSDADVDGFSFDAGLHYGTDRWGWGLAYDSGGEVEGNGSVSYTARDVPSVPGLSSVVDALASGGSSRLSFDLPQELRTGLWVAPSPAWNFEIDLAWTGWSSVDTTEVSFSRHLFALPASIPPQVGAGTERRERRWDDTISARLGTEFRVSGSWSVSAGVAVEPSPVPSSTVEPGFARGDALVLGTGFTYRIRNIAFDLGYSFFQYDDRGASGQELQHPQASSTYEAHDQVFGFSVSWGG
jgi:long-chain fatty acid transport protein